MHHFQQRNVPRNNGIPSNALAEKLTADIFGQRRWEEDNTARERVTARRAARDTDKPRRRNRDWMLHDGNLYYAKKGASFRVGGYTKLDLVTRMRVGLGDLGAIGIGTVDIIAERALDSADICVITPHDVLHVPLAPCNGISICHLQDADIRIAMLQDDCHAFCARTGKQLFAGTRFGNHFRMALAGESAAGQTILD